jgi:hydrogenase/urease accessory protein HupE
VSLATALRLTAVYRALAFAAALVGLPALAAAHPAPFSYLDLRIDGGRISGTLTVHDFDAARELRLPDAGVLLDPAAAGGHGAALADLLARRIRLLPDGQPVPVSLSDVTAIPDRQALRLVLSATAARAPAHLRLEATLFPYDGQHQTFVSVYEDGSLRHQAILDARRPVMDYYAGTWSGAAAVLATFVPAGVHHIVIGPDHILFLVGLLLLGGTAARLGLIVTAFTVGHSITLSLAVLGAVSPPAWIVEPAIAITVILVGVDNLLVGREPAAPGSTSQRRDLRAPMAGIFGLIHGFGFAAVLREFGLPQAALGWSLFGFNLGVELGQLALVVPLALGLAALRRQRPVAARRIAMVGSVVVVLAGAYWFVQRVFFPEGIA